MTILVRNLILSLMFFIFLGTVSHCAITTGCIRYVRNAYGQPVCVQCIFGMGLTTNYSCQFCKIGFTVVGGACKKVQNNVNNNTPIQNNSNVINSNNGQSTAIMMPFPLAVANLTNTSTNSISSTSLWNATNIITENKSNQNGLSQSYIPQILQSNTTQPGQISNASNIISTKQDIQFIFKDSTTANASQNQVSNTGKAVSSQQPTNKNSQNVVFLFKDQSSDKSQSVPTDPNSQSSQTTNTLASLGVSNTISKPSNQNDAFGQFGDIKNLFFSSFGQDFNPNTQQFSSQEAQVTPTEKLSSQNRTNVIQVAKNQPLLIPLAQPIAAQTLDKPFMPNTIITASTPSLSANDPTNSKPIVHKYPQYPFCFDFADDQCWACIPGYLLNLIINKCQPYIKPPPVILPVAQTSKQNQSQPGSSPKSSPEQFCNVFSQSANKCEECFRNYYYDKGTNLCQQVDPLCRTYHSDTGSCLTCYIKYQLKDGKCINTRRL